VVFIKIPVPISSVFRHFKVFYYSIYRKKYFYEILHKTTAWASCGETIKNYTLTTIFQVLPGVMRNMAERAMVIVVTPLISIMRDQVKRHSIARVQRYESL